MNTVHDDLSGAPENVSTGFGFDFESSIMYFLKGAPLGCTPVLLAESLEKAKRSSLVTIKEKKFYGIVTWRSLLIRCKGVFHSSISFPQCDRNQQLKVCSKLVPFYKKISSKTL